MIRPIEEPQDLSSMREAWDSLLERSPAANPFLTFEWVSTWWAGFGEDRRLFLLAAFDETSSRLKGVAPFMISRSAGFRVIEFIGTGLADRLNFLIEAGAEGLIDEFFAFLNTRKKVWDIISLRDVPADDPHLACLSGAAARSGWRILKKRTTIAPYLPIRITWEEYLASKSAHFRHIRKQIEHRLSRRGIDFQVRRIRSPLDGQIRDDVSEILRKSWKWRDMTSAGQGELTEGFYFDLFREFAMKGWLDLWLGYLNGRPAAYQIDFDFKNTIWIYNCAYAREFQQFSPGSILMARAIEDAFRRGRTECDFLRGQEEYKSHWTSERRCQQDLVFVRNTPRSRAAHLALFTIGQNVRRGANYLAWIYRKRASRSGRPSKNG
jgi:CelD/BcsL family acetyltransferase involved in cellulose biosynthesis